MPLHKVYSERERIDDLIRELDSTLSGVDDRIQHVYANHIVIVAAGYVEKSPQRILSEYGRSHANSNISRYIGKSVSRYRSLNCEKIEEILNNFNKAWWPAIKNITDESDMECVNSIKGIRDQIAHGDYNGTGYSQVKKYYAGCKKFISNLCEVVLGGS